MINLPNTLRKIAEQYSAATDDEKRDLIQYCYHKEGLSWKNIADLCQTYSNKIVRDARVLGIQSRTKSESQTLALQKGRIKHPTKGIGHSTKTREKISEKMAESWNNLTKEEQEQRRQIGRDNWNAMSKQEQDAFIKQGADAIRETSKKGSELEQFIYRQLIKHGFTHVKLHEKHRIANRKLHIDIFLPKLKTAIEIDGPSHFTNIWGAEALFKVQKADREKDSLLLGLGLCVIRVQQKSSLSAKFKRDILKQLLSKLEEFKLYPPRDKRYVIIGDK